MPAFIETRSRGAARWSTMAEVGATGADTSGLDVARRRAEMQALSEDDREGTHPPRDPVDSAPKKLTVVHKRFASRRADGTEAPASKTRRVAARALAVTERSAR